ncbi:unnamed protein product [Effrenium voratum]|nr:unnamed protein product [Effrenium voratum]
MEALSPQQEALLEELAYLEEEVSPQPRLDELSTLEALQKQRAAGQAAYQRRLQESKASRLRWMQQLQLGICSSRQQQLQLLQALDTLEAEHRDLERKSAWLRSQCQEALSERDRLEAYCAQVAERLDVLQCSASIAQELDQGSDLLLRPELEPLLQRLEAAAAYVESRYDFSDAKSCRSNFDHLRNRVCILVRSTLQHALEAAESQVQEILWQQEESEESSVDTQVFYTAFHLAASAVRPALEVLQRQRHLHSQYGQALDSAAQQLAQLRLRLDTEAHWQALQAVRPLPELVRQAVGYLLDRAGRELCCFEAFFPRGDRQALDLILGRLCERCRQVLKLLLVIVLVRQFERQPTNSKELTVAAVWQTWQDRCHGQRPDHRALASAAQPTWQADTEKALLAAPAEDWPQLAEAAEVLQACLQECRIVTVRLALQQMLRSVLLPRLEEAARRELSKVSLELSDATPERLLEAPTKAADQALKVLAACYGVLEAPAFESLASHVGAWRKEVDPDDLCSRLVLLRQNLELWEQLAAFEDDAVAEAPSFAGLPAYERLSAAALRQSRGERHARWRRSLREARALRACACAT